MPDVIKWMSIQLLHNVVRTHHYLNEYQSTPLPTVAYKAKVKLHGTNCGVQVREDGVFPQSRGQLLTLPSGDRCGFARWVDSHKEWWASITPGITVFGEWCGQGVARGTAVTQIGKKVYAVFAIQVGYGESAEIFYDPEDLAALLPELFEDVYILPWYEPGDVTINYADKAGMEIAAAHLNKVVETVESEDPWVKGVFGISGIGEGLVLYPVGGHATGDFDRLGRIMFKAKGAKHAVIKTSEPVQIDPEVVESIEEFVDLVVTETRLEQGLSEACGGEANMRLTGAFLRWVLADVEKESVAELEASDLTWDQVRKAVETKTVGWLKNRAGR